MKKFLKFLVITLGIIIIILFIFTIVSLISKYKNEYSVRDKLSNLNIQINEDYKIFSIDIEENKLYMNLMNNFTEEFLIKVYSLKDGSFLSPHNHCTGNMDTSHKYYSIAYYIDDGDPDKTQTYCGCVTFIIE